MRTRNKTSVKLWIPCGEWVVRYVVDTRNFVWVTTSRQEEITTGHTANQWSCGTERCKGGTVNSQKAAQAYLSATAWTRVQNCTHYKNSELRNTVELNSKLSARKTNAKLLCKNKTKNVVDIVTFVVVVVVVVFVVVVFVTVIDDAKIPS